MIRILHVIDSLGAGGAERLVVDVINGLPEYEHHLVILNGPETLRSELPKTQAFLNLQRRGFREIFKHVRSLKKYIASHKIDLVHSHLYFASVIARLATPKRIPLVNSIHIISSLDNYSKNRLSLYLEKFTYRQRHHIIAVSQEVLKDFDKWVGIKGSSQVMYNFINDEFYSGQIKEEINTQPFRLVAVGNLRHQKNYPYLLEAFKNMPANVTLDIYGDGDMKEALQAEINRHHLNVRLMGSQKGLHKVLPEYDAFVMCSFFEGQPLSLLEAIASGLPAILSDIPVLREVTGDYAVYIDLNNSSDLVKKVEAIIRGHIDLLKNRRPALERISQFARKEIYLKNLTALYQQKLQQASTQMV